MKNSIVFFLILWPGVLSAQMPNTISPTFGSTGRPMLFELPGGGSARICTKKDTYPNGRPFVGYGVQPDMEVKRTLAEYLEGRDAILERARLFLRGGVGRAARGCPEGRAKRKWAKLNLTQRRKRRKESIFFANFAPLRESILRLFLGVIFLNSLATKTARREGRAGVDELLEFRKQAVQRRAFPGKANRVFPGWKGPLSLTVFIAFW